MTQDPAEPDYDPAHAADMAAILRGEEHPAHKRAGGPAPAPRPATEAARESARLAVLVNRCPHREPIRCGCADRKSTCRLDPERPVERTHAECVDCVRSDRPCP